MGEHVWVYCDSLHGYVWTKRGYSAANKVHGRLINNLIGHFVLDNYTVITRVWNMALKIKSHRGRASRVLFIPNRNGWHQEHIDRAPIWLCHSTAYSHACCTSSTCISIASRVRDCWWWRPMGYQLTSHDFCDCILRERLINQFDNGREWQIVTLVYIIMSATPGVCSWSCKQATTPAERQWRRWRTEKTIHPSSLPVKRKREQCYCVTFPMLYSLWYIFIYNSVRACTRRSSTSTCTDLYGPPILCAIQMKVQYDVWTQ